MSRALDQRCADRHVAARLFQALVDRAGRVADLQLEVPKDVEERLDDLLHRGRRLPAQQEQKIDVGRRGEQTPPVSADRDDSGQSLSRRPAGRANRTATSSETFRRSSIWALRVSAQARPAPPASSALRAASRPSASAACRRGIAARRVCGRVARIALMQRRQGLKQFRTVEPPCRQEARGRAERGPRSTAGALARDIAAIFAFRSPPARRRGRREFLWLGPVWPRSRPRSRQRDRGRRGA